MAWSGGGTIFMNNANYVKTYTKTVHVNYVQCDAERLPDGLIVSFRSNF